MKLSSKIRLALAGVAACATVFVALPASASNTDIMILSGTGTISPGLTPGGGSQTFDFAGTGIVSAFGVEGVISCAWAGTDSIGQTTASNGLFDGSCSTSSGSGSVHGGYNRSLAVGVGEGGGFTGGLLSPHAFNGNCVFVPTGFNGIALTAFSETCLFHLT